MPRACGFDVDGTPRNLPARTSRFARIVGDGGVRRFSRLRQPVPAAMAAGNYPDPGAPAALSRR